MIADAAGKLFILVDDEDRENEGDLRVVGEWASAEAINFMAKHGRGLVCFALTSGAYRGALAVPDGTAQRKPAPDGLHRVDRGAEGDDRYFMATAPIPFARRSTRNARRRISRHPAISSRWWRVTAERWCVPGTPRLSSTSPA